MFCYCFLVNFIIYFKRKDVIGMRKVKILIFSIIVCLFINVSALTYTEEEVVNRINSSKVSVNELLGDLINWSDTNKNATKKLVNKDFVKSIK